MQNLQINTSDGIKVDKKHYHKLISLLKKELKFDISSLIVNFVTSKKIHTINFEYLKHDYSTDIVTFNYTGSNILLDGELYISVDDAETNARKYSVTLFEELNRLVIHGILHLLGFDDMNAKDRRIMKEHENNLQNLSLERICYDNRNS